MPRTADFRPQILARLKAGKGQRAIARELGCSPGYVGEVARAEKAARAPGQRRGRNSTSPPAATDAALRGRAYRANKNLEAASGELVDRGELAARMRLASLRATDELLRLMEERKVGAYQLTGAAALLAKTAELLDGHATERTEAIPAGEREAVAERLLDDALETVERAGLRVLPGGLDDDRDDERAAG